MIFIVFSDESFCKDGIPQEYVLIRKLKRVFIVEMNILYALYAAK